MGCNWSKRYDSKDLNDSSHYQSAECDFDYASEKIDQIFEATIQTPALYVDAATSPFWSRKSAGVNVSAGDIPEWEGTGESFENKVKDKSEVLKSTFKQIEVLRVDSPVSYQILHVNTSPITPNQFIVEQPLIKSLTNERNRELSNILECRICAKPAKGYCIHCGLKRLCKECYKETHTEGDRHAFIPYKMTDKINISSVKKIPMQLLE